LKKFNQGRKPSGGRDFGKKSFGGRNSGSRGFGGRDRDRERPPMHKAICDECGESCEVPFRPTGDKPIFCSDCFRVRRDDAPRSSFKESRGKPSFESRQMHSVVCSECGKKCEVPFKPTGDKPVYCSECFEDNRSSSPSSGRRGGSENSSDLKDLLNAINIKLDIMMDLFEEKFPIESGAKKTEEEWIDEEILTEEKEEKPKKEAKPKKTAVKKISTKKAGAKKKK